MTSDHLVCHILLTIIYTYFQQNKKLYIIIILQGTVDNNLGGDRLVDQKA